MSESKFPPHPAATAFPLMEGEAYKQLRDDVAANGVRIPIVLAQHDAQWMILDGRNRQRACDETGRKGKYEYFDGDFRAAVRYAISANISRRHLNESQRGMVAARLADLEHGGSRASGKSAGCTQAEAADMLNVGERTVRDAKVVASRGVAELVQEVDRGEIAVSRAVEIARLTEDQQRDQLEQLKSKEKPKREPAEARDRWMSREVRLEESDIRGLQALIDYSEDGGPPLVQHGIRVLRKLVPQVGK